MSHGFVVSFRGVTLLLTLWILTNIFRRVLRVTVWRSRRRLELKNQLWIWVVLGSGGHTAEMLHMLSGLKDARVLMISCITDKHSERAAGSFMQKSTHTCQVLYLKIERLREVGGSFMATPFKCARAVCTLLPAYLSKPPAAVLLNGPGSCLPVAGSALLMELLTGRSVKLIYVESFCRVRSISCTGRILFWLVDRFFVHWEALHKQHPWRYELLAGLDNSQTAS